MTERPEKSETIGKRYDFAGIEDELLHKYQPEYLDHGGEHLVFEIPSHPDVVVKVSIESITECLNWQKDLKVSAEVYAHDPDVQRELRYRIDIANNAYREILEYFPREQVLTQRYITFTVAVTPELITQLARDYYRREVVAVSDDFPSAVHVVAMVQQKAAALESSTTRPLFEHGYLVTNQEKQDKIMEFLFPTTVVTPDEEATPKVVKGDFVNRAIRYTSETGRILDIAGTNNVILTESPSGEAYQLIDAIYPAHWNKSYSDFVTFMQAAATDDYHCSLGSMGQKASMVVNVVDYVCKINQAAMENTVPASLDPLAWIPESDRPKAVQLIKDCIAVWKGEVQAGSGG